MSETPTRLSFVEALKHLGWFSLLFTVVIGGTSVLALLEQVFVNHQLVAAFQWIVDGYGRIVAVIGAMFEPLVAPLVDWLNRQLRLELHLGPHWRPLFVLAMVVVMALARSAWRNGSHADAALAVVVIGFGALLGALVSGLLPLSGGWWMQGLGAAAPTLAVFSFFGLAAALSGGEEKTPLVAAFLSIAISGVVAFVLGAGLSFVPGIGDGAGVLALSVLVALFGAGFLIGGLRTGDAGDAVLGLTVLGGFATAALVLIADAAVKALG